MFPSLLQESLQPLCLQKVFCPFLFLFFWDTHNMNVISLDMPPRFLKLPSLKNFLFLLLCFGELVPSTALSFRSLILSLTLSAVEPLQCIFQSSFCILQLHDFSLILPYSLYIFVEVLTVFVHSSPKFRERLYYHCFELLSDKLFISISLRYFFPEVLSCSFVWNILLCFILLHYQCLFLCIRGSNLGGVALYGR